MAEASFDYSIINSTFFNIIAIKDQNRPGSKSVTNDIENVVEKISRSQNINAADYKIIYRDSLGVWDGWDPIKEKFYSLNEKDKEKAIGKLIEIEKSK